MGKSSKYVKYVKAWEDDPRLKNWISPIAEDVKAAYCKVCRRPLHPHKKSLLLHSQSKKHIKNMSLYKSVLESCQPLKDTDIGDSAYEILPITPKKDSLAFTEFNSFQHNKHEQLEKNITISVYPESQEIIQEETLEVQEDEEIGIGSTVLLSSSDSAYPSVENMVSWKNIPEFQGWLSVDSNNISCLVCKKELKPSKTLILKHAAGKLHQNKCAKQNIIVPNELENYRMSASFLPDNHQLERCIDLRSDTVTKPSKEMMEAMTKAELGDDYYSNDPSVKELESKVANLLGKECAILTPSGTMSNLIAVMAHCWNRESEVIAGDQSHLCNYSQGSINRLFSISLQKIKNNADGTFCLKTLKEMIEQNKHSTGSVKTLVCLENTHNRMGGKALPMDWLDQIGIFCEENDIYLHMDGARLMNACIFSGRTPDQMVKYCHSSSFCLNKGYGAPMGSVVVGDFAFIERAKSIRTLLGGSMHQSGIFAAACLYSIEHNTSKLHWDHTNARAIAQSIRDLHSTAVRVELDDVQTNFVHLYTDNIRVNSQEFCDRLAMVKENEIQELGFEVKLYLKPITASIVRLATHCDLSKNDVHLIIHKIQFVISEYDNMLALNYLK